MRFQFPSLVVSKTTSTLYVWPTLEECNLALRSVEISNGKETLGGLWPHHCFNRKYWVYKFSLVFVFGIVYFSREIKPFARRK